MAQSKLRNQITIKIYEDTGKIEFKNQPTGFELMTAKLILDECLSFEFDAPYLAQLAVQVYQKIQNVEEVRF